MVDELKQAHDDKIKSQRKDKHLDDRFDEILDALRRMEKRLHSGGRSRTEKIMNDAVFLVGQSFVPQIRIILRKIMKN